jgi:CBS domain-containing protein
MRAKDVMSPDVLTIQAEATVLEAARLLINGGVSAVPVVDTSGMLVGILSEADIIRHTGGVAPTDLSDVANAARTMQEAQSRRVADVMTKDVATVSEDTSLHEIADLMLKLGIKRVPIVSRNAVVGIVSRVDLLRALVSVGLDAYTRVAPAAENADEALRAAVIGVLVRMGWSDVSRSDVVISRGTVHLWGMVASREIGRNFVEAVRSVPGVGTVDNHMHVGRPVRMRGTPAP